MRCGCHLGFSLNTGHQKEKKTFLGSIWSYCCVKTSCEFDVDGSLKCEKMLKILHKFFFIFITRFCDHIKILMKYLTQSPLNMFRDILGPQNLELETKTLEF